MPARKGYRKCARCHNNRVLRRYVGTRGRICDTCRARGRSTSTKNQRLQETFDITHDEWLAILRTQGDVCFICQGKRTGKGGVPLYDTDHDHALEKGGTPIRYTVRGLLCKRCNRRLLPACLDNIAILKRAIWYLENAHARTQRVLELKRAGYEFKGDGVWERAEDLGDTAAA